MVNKSSSPAPEYKTSGSAGMDLRANTSVIIQPMTQEKFGTGIYVHIPEGYEGQVRSRSGFSTDNQTIITTGVGTIDSDYRGEIQIVMFNLSKEPVVIVEGDRVAQLIITPIERVEVVQVSNLEDTDRGSDGFGSTGK
jgi:dUTP pyrophosphatase